MNRASAVLHAATASVGLAIWMTLVTNSESEPGFEPDNPHVEWFVPAVVVATVVAGALAGRRSNLVAPALIGPMLIVAPWTTPKGDFDGLWSLIFLELLVMMLFAWAVARMSGWLRVRLWSHHQDRRKTVTPD